MPGPWSITSSTAKSRSTASDTTIAAERGEYLTALETRLSTIVRTLSASPTISAGASCGSNVTMRASAASLCSCSTRRTTSGISDRADRLRLHRARLVVGEQVLDQLLQRQRVLADDAHDLALLGRQLAADVVAQQLGAFAHRGERRLELVRDVPQEAVLLLLELGAAASAAIRGAARDSAGPAAR